MTPARPDRPSHTIQLEDSGILLLHVKKVWSALEADDFFDELRPVHARARRLHGRVLALAQVSAVQSPIVAMRVRNHALAIKQQGDRTAVLVGSILGKLQLARLGGDTGFGLFMSEDQARDWLLAV